MARDMLAMNFSGDLFPNPKAKLIIFHSVATCFRALHASMRPYFEREHIWANRAESLGLGLRFLTLFLVHLLLLLATRIPKNAYDAPPCCKPGNWSWTWWWLVGGLGLRGGLSHGSLGSPRVAPGGLHRRLRSRGATIGASPPRPTLPLPPPCLALGLASGVVVFTMVFLGPRSSALVVLGPRSSSVLGRGRWRGAAPPSPRQACRCKPAT